MKYDHLGYKPDVAAEMQARWDADQQAASRAKEAEREKFSADFARFCGILSGTGIGQMVDH